jgi:hypothetical protein
LLGYFLPRVASVTRWVAAFSTNPGGFGPNGRALQQRRPAHVR